MEDQVQRQVTVARTYDGGVKLNISIKHSGLCLIYTNMNDFTGYSGINLTRNGVMLRFLIGVKDI